MNATLHAAPVKPATPAPAFAVEYEPTAAHPWLVIDTQHDAVWYGYDRQCEARAEAERCNANAELGEGPGRRAWDWSDLDDAPAEGGPTGPAADDRRWAAENLNADWHTQDDGPDDHSVTAFDWHLEQHAGWAEVEDRLSAGYPIF